MQMTMSEAIAHATKAAIDDGALVMGLGVKTDPGHIFGTIPHWDYDRGLIETPTSEAAMTGVAVGMCMAGKKVIMVHQRVEFALLAVEQIINNAAKLGFISNGRYRCPLLIRLIIGRGWGQGPTHSQSLEALWSGIPGLTVCYPSTPQDAYDMVKTAMASDGPTIMLEHRWLHATKGDVSCETKPREDYAAHRILSPFRRGYATVVGWGYVMPEITLAAGALMRAGIGIDAFDLRYLNPSTLDGIVYSAKETQRLLVVDPGYEHNGIGEAIAHRIVRRANYRAWAKVIGIPPIAMPASKEINRHLYPDALEIFQQVCRLMEGWKNHEPPKELTERRMRANNDQPDPTFVGPF